VIVAAPLEGGSFFEVGLMSRIPLLNRIASSFRHFSIYAWIAPAAAA
jgi:hypothetical protein